MKKNNEVKVISRLFGLLLCLALIQGACAQPDNSQKDLSFENVQIENVTIENITYSDGSYVPVPDEDPVDGNDETVTGVTHNINPNYYSMYLMAGNSETFSVTFENKGNETLDIIPKVVSMPYSAKNLNESWITISPTNATVEPGAVQEFSVKVDIPKDAEGGYYQTGIVFTEDLAPGSTDYLNMLRLDISVQALAKVELQTTYISDSVEAGQEYVYSVKIKNIIDREVTIDPKITKNQFIIYNGNTMSLGDNITISAPSTIQAGEIANMTITVPVPEDATGYYSGSIDLNIDGSANDGSNPQLNLNFNTIQFPTVPYVKTFKTTNNDPIAIEVSTDSYDQNYGIRISPEKKEPSFDISLKYKSKPVKLSLSKTVDNTYISTGQPFPIWAVEDNVYYQNYGMRHAETYTASGKAGQWELSILPENTESFGYTITVGKEK